MRSPAPLPLAARQSTPSHARSTTPPPGADTSFTWTPKRVRFCEEYLVDLTASAAARRAGYSARSARDIGYELLLEPAIQARIQAEQAKRAARTEVTADYVLRRLRENVERAMQAEPVLDKLGKPTGGYVYEGAVANGALKLLGQHLGMFAELHKHTGAIATADLTSAMTPQQRRHAAAGLLALAASRA